MSLCVEREPSASGARALAADSPKNEGGGRLPFRQGWRSFCFGSVRWKRQVPERKSEWRGMQRMNGKGLLCGTVKLGGVKRNRAATAWLVCGKDKCPGSERRGMERNERLKEGSCVGWRCFVNAMKWNEQGKSHVEATTKTVTARLARSDPQASTTISGG